MRGVLRLEVRADYVPAALTANVLLGGNVVGRGMILGMLLDAHVPGRSLRARLGRAQSNLATEPRWAMTASPQRRMGSNC